MPSGEVRVCAKAMILSVYVASGAMVALQDFPPEFLDQISQNAPLFPRSSNQMGEPVSAFNRSHPCAPAVPERLAETAEERRARALRASRMRPGEKVGRRAP